MTLHQTGIILAIALPIIVASIIAVPLINNHFVQIGLSKEIMIYQEQTQIQYIEWYAQPNMTYQVERIMIKNIGEYPTQIKMINTPISESYNLTWYYEMYLIEVNEVIPLVLELSTSSDFELEKIKTAIEVIR